MPSESARSANGAGRCRITIKAKADPGNGTKACFGCPTIHFSFMQHVSHSIKSRFSVDAIAVE